MSRPTAAAAAISLSSVFLPPALAARSARQGAMLAHGGNILGPTTVADHVTRYAGTKAPPTVTVTCNGTSTCGDGKCSGIGAAGATSLALTCGTPCVGSVATPKSGMALLPQGSVPDRLAGTGSSPPAPAGWNPIG